MEEETVNIEHEGAVYNEHQHQIKNAGDIEEDDVKPLKAEDPNINRPEWIPDEQRYACVKCGVQFGVFTRRHHCRGCGEIFCAKCCGPKRLFLPRSFGYQQSERVCQKCFVRYVNFDTTRHFDVYGEPDKPVIILLTGASATRMGWLPVLPYLSEEFRVYTLDFPGHGSRENEKLTLESALACIDELYDNEISPRKCLIWGHSMGGYLGMSYMTSRTDRLVGAVISGAGTGMGIPGSKWRGAMILKGMGLVYKSLSPGTLHNLMLNSKDMLDMQMEDELFEESYLRCGTYFDQWDGVVECMNSPDYPILLNKLGEDFPVLYMSGEDDMRSSEQAILQATKNAKLEVFPGGHVFIADKRTRESVCKTVAEFAHKAFEDYGKPHHHHHHEDHHHHHEEEASGSGAGENGGFSEVVEDLQQDSGEAHYIHLHHDEVEQEGNGLQQQEEVQEEVMLLG